MKSAFNKPIFGLLFRALVAFGLISIFALLPLSGANAGSSLSCSSWRIVSSPNPDPYENYLSGVAAISAKDIWAVGAFAGSTNTLTQHWDGTQWTTIPSPNVDHYNWLSAVAKVPGTNTVWAVGGYSNDLRYSQTLIMYWNGTTWAIIASPNAGQWRNNLVALVAVSRNNIWAVGNYTTSGFPGSAQTFIEHWDGTSWSVIPSPNLGIASYLSGVVARKANDIWAVGSYEVDNTGTTDTLVEHWGGTSWGIVASPNSGNVSELFQITLVPGTTNLWSVGNMANYNSNLVPLTEFWNGTSWSIVASPNEGIVSTLSDIRAISAKNIWAVGESYASQSASSTLIEHWDGASWSIASSPNAGSMNSLRAITRVPGKKQVYAVGTFVDSNNIYKTLIETNC